MEDERAALIQQVLESYAELTVLLAPSADEAPRLLDLLATLSPGELRTVTAAFTILDGLPAPACDARLTTPS